MIMAAGLDVKNRIWHKSKPLAPGKNIAADFDCKPSYWQSTMRKAFCALPTNSIENGSTIYYFCCTAQQCRTLIQFDRMTGAALCYLKTCCLRAYSIEL
jgi:hypothetical protein